MPESPPPNAETGWSVSLWFQTTENRSVLFGTSELNNSYRQTPGILLGLNPYGRFQASVGRGDSSKRLAGNVLCDGKWHHVAVSWNGSNITLYIDGDHSGTTSYSRPIEHAGQFSLGTLDFEGRLDEVVVSQSPRSRKEIAALYNTTRPDG